MSTVAGVILAAGKSSRMGRPKALIHLGGRSMLEALVEAYAAAKLEPVIVVASGAVLEAARTIDGVRAVEGDPAAAMIDSVARGLAALPEGAQGAVIQPVDAPFTEAEMIAALLAGGTQRTRVLCHGGRPGHPVYVPRSLFAEIAEQPEGGLREVLEVHEVELVEWSDPRVLADLDTPSDLAAWAGEGSTALH